MYVYVFIEKERKICREAYIYTFIIDLCLVVIGGNPVYVRNLNSSVSPGCTEESATALLSLKKTK
jgi:hypothetical protein